MNIMDQIGMYKELCPTKIAVRTESTNVTYKELIENINRVSHGILESISAKEDSKVAMLLSNSIDFIEIFLAAAKIGILVVPIDPKWSIVQNNYILEKYNPDIVFVQDIFKNHLQQDKLKGKKVIECSEESNGMYNEWKNQYPCVDVKVGNDREELLISFTSGTTGFPKGYVRTHTSWFESFYATNSEFNITSNDCVMAPGPFVHSLSVYAMTHSLFIGATFLLVDKYEAQKVLNLIQKSQNTVLYMVPTMLQSILNCIYENGYEDNKYDVKIIITSGNKCKNKIKKEVSKVLKGVGIYEFYGASEASFISVLDPIGSEFKPNSVGRAFKNVFVSIRDEEGNELGVNEIGKIFVSSKMIFSGYYEDKIETQKIYHGKWLELGDYGKKDEDGYLYIVGRAQNMIISGGLNIYPEEIETVLNKLEFVEEVVVVGRTNQYWGEEVVAFIKSRKNKTFDVAMVDEHCKKYLPTYKRPHEYIQVNEFTYTSTGKISRVAIQKMLEKNLSKR